MADGQITADEGSSPHTRGARHAHAVEREERGIIPAYAGSTAQKEIDPALAGDHPRIRGEHLGDGHVLGRPAGSSPHTRGARLSLRR